MAVTEPYEEVKMKLTATTEPVINMEIPKGDKGDPGVGIEQVVLNDDYKLTIYFTNGTVWVSPTPIRGEKGEKGDTGDKGDKGDPGMTLSVNGTTLEIVTT